MIKNTSSSDISRSAFEAVINRAIQGIDLNLKKINVTFDTDKLSWEWIGYVAPQLGHWVTITFEEGNWHLSAVTEQCGVLKIIHANLEAALTELMLVSVPHSIH